MTRLQHTISDLRELNDYGLDERLNDLELTLANDLGPRVIFVNLMDIEEYMNDYCYENLDLFDALKAELV